jgi:alpha,alpha-trehalose-phosphate synthase [UDP-forming]
MLGYLRLQLRFLLPLAAAMVLAAYVALPLIDKVTLRWFTRDIGARGALAANALHDSTVDALASRDARRLSMLLDRTAQDERVFAIGFCRTDHLLFARSAAFPTSLSCANAIETARRADPRVELRGGAVLVTRHPLAPSTESATSEPLGISGQLILLHDLSFIERRSQDTRRYLIAFLAALGFVVAAITMLVAQLSWRGWIEGARALLRGDIGPVGPLSSRAELGPLADELRTRLRELEDEYRRSRGPETGWTPERLRDLLHAELRGDEIIVVSNREPYIHDRDAQGIRVRRPASGLVTAIEPVMRACSGTWIAHGSGSADRDVVDLQDRVAVPPEHPMYSLRRIWLTAEEEQGYYYGFANEGLWPLCHVAHVRPVFRESDWKAYRAINQRFADAVVKEARTEDPVVLVQDYHFALVPAMVREKLPQATILTFWHIPWPNPESFGICPWRREILQGLLGSTILGFHTKFHCKNFLETVDRFLEARIEHEHSVVAVAERETLVESYPISIEWPEPMEGEWASSAECRRSVIERLELPDGAIIGLGVDRFDYTKGIVERLNAVERMLEKHPELAGTFVFVQVASPTRSSLEEYRGFQQQVERLASKINARFGAAGYRPIQLLAEHHEHEQLLDLYRAADICVVTSLHDGMNLVCKEFVAARDDEQGVLVLSRFAGAAREMREALIVNPYHVEETADAIFQATRMSAGEQRERMISLRNTVRDFNVFRWAGRMLGDAARWRLRARVEARVRKHRMPESRGAHD